MADDDQLTQRERRALRRRQVRAPAGPSPIQRMRPYLPLLVVGLIVLGAVAALVALKESREAASGKCVDAHWHATVAFYVPQDRDRATPAADVPVRVDFAAIRTSRGTYWYDFGNSAPGPEANSMSASIHMHLDASSEETGPHNIAISQLHMEGPVGKCVPVSQAFSVLDVVADDDSLRFDPPHDKIPAQSGTFTANGDRELRWFIQQANEDFVWEWRETDWDEVSGKQLQDGDSLLVVLGNYTEEQIEQMKSQVPVPISRPRVPQATPTTSASSTDAATSGTTTAATTTSGEPTTGTTTPAAADGTGGGQPDGQPDGQADDPPDDAA